MFVFVSTHAYLIPRLRGKDESWYQIRTCEELRALFAVGACKEPFVLIKANISE